MPFNKFCHRFIVVLVLISRRAEPFPRHADLGPKREQARGHHRQDARRHHELQALRNCDKSPFDQNVGLALKVIRANDLAAQSELAAKLGGFRLDAQEGIWPAFEYIPFTIFGADHAAQPVRFFKERPLQLSSLTSSFFQVIGCAEPCDSAADNGNPHHALWPDGTGNFSEARLANAEMNVGEVFSDSLRHNFIPCSEANCLKRTSMS